jgi:hypothetical protein
VDNTVWWSDFKQFVDNYLQASRVKDIRIGFSGPLPSIEDLVEGRAEVTVTFNIGKT